MNKVKSLAWLTQESKTTNRDQLLAAEQRQAQLTKPPGSLGKLEQLAIRFAGLQNSSRPAIDNISITVFAADHGVAAENVSAFPQSVTNEMLNNFANGGAAISVIAKVLGTGLEVIDVGTVSDPTEALAAANGVINNRVAPGTANICRQPAMTEGQLQQALNIGRAALKRAGERGSQLFIVGDMGIANSTVSAALACAYLGVPAEQLVGSGSGLDAHGINHKTQVIKRALDRHALYCNDPLETLRRLGGLEIAAMTGAYVAAGQAGLPVVVDGYIATAAALAACRIQPGTGDWLLYGHVSAEPGHRLMLDALQVEPLLELNMCLGEASGAAMSVPLIKLALALHNNMATFDEAGVSKKASVGKAHASIQ